MSTPPVAVVLTFPNRFATNVVEPPPVIPVGRENATCRLTTPLYVVGVVERLKDPRLLKPAKPPEVIPLKLPGRNEIPDGGVAEVVPARVISSARALPEPKANIAASKTNAITHVRFTSVVSPLVTLSSTALLGSFYSQTNHQCRAILKRCVFFLLWPSPKLERSFE